MRKLEIMTVAGAALLLAAAGCSSNGTVDVSMSSTELHTVPGMPSGAQLQVTVEEVAVHVADTAEATPPADAEADGGGWVTVFAGERALDLSQIDATRAFLGEASVPAGKLTQVRLVLAADPQLIVDGVAAPVACPSCTQTGIKIVPHGTLTVPEGGTLDLELVFEADASLGRDGTAWRLDPVLKL